MTLPEQLRAIADRLEAAEEARAAAVWELYELASGTTIAMRDGSSIEGDSAAVPVAAERGEVGAVPVEDPAPPSAPIAGAVQTARTPARHAGGAGSTPATRSNTCPECGNQTPTSAGLVTHRSRMHGVKPPVGAHGRGRVKVGLRSAAARQADRKKVPTNGVGYSAPIGKAAIAPQPVIRDGKEVWLCTRCRDRFPSAEALKGHMMKGHPPATAATRPFGDQPVLEHMARGSE